MIITKYSRVASLTATKSAVFDVLKALDCATALAVFIMLKHDDFTDFAKLHSKPVDFNNVNTFSDAFFAVNLVKKSEGLISSEGILEASYKKFVQAELSCRETNRLFMLRDQGYLKFDNRVERVLFYARRKIAEILARSRIWDHDGGFGPGASSTCKGENTHLLCKTTAFPICGRNLWPHLRKYLQHSGSYAASIMGVEVSGPVSILNPIFQEFNEMTTVPKDFRSKRVIAIEPDGNIFFQKMLGNWVRTCLRADGLDLNRRQPVHGRLACEGSISDAFATIDFESASDTVSFQLVKDLLPRYAFRLLDKSRSAYTRLPDGRTIKNEKFSSMGNGFTFELETLIFYGILHGCYKELKLMAHSYDTPSCNMSVFGDDVICLTKAAKLFIEVCRVVGFKTNLDKTYLSGEFRESCGYDYYKGIKVASLRVKKLLENDFDRIDLANRLRSRTLLGDFSDPRFKNAWQNLIRPVAAVLKTFGPFDSFNTVIWTSIHDTRYARSLNGSRLWIRRPKLLPRREGRLFGANAHVSAMLYVCPSALSLSKRGSGKYFCMTNSSVDHYDPSKGLWLS